jgi:hypothetical protein
LRFLELEDFRAALFVERNQPLRFRLKPTPRQGAVESVGIVADEFDVVHWKWLKTPDQVRP